MKEYTEKIISIPYDGDSDMVIEQIDKEAKEMYDEGWFFIESKTDQLINNITLFFERDVGEP